MSDVLAQSCPRQARSQLEHGVRFVRARRASFAVEVVVVVEHLGDDAHTARPDFWSVRSIDSLAEQLIHGIDFGVTLVQIDADGFENLFHGETDRLAGGECLDVHVASSASNVNRRIRAGFYARSGVVRVINPDFYGLGRDR